MKCPLKPNNRSFFCLLFFSKKRRSERGTVRQRHFVEPVNNVRCEAVIAAAGGGFAFPEGARRASHIKEISLYVFDELFVFAVAEEKFKTEIIADESV